MSFILDALDKVEEEKKGQATEPVSRIEGGREFTDTRRFAWTLSALAVAVVAFSLAAFVWVQWQREREQRLDAAEQRLHAAQAAPQARDGRLESAPVALGSRAESNEIERASGLSRPAMPRPENSPSTAPVVSVEATPESSESGEVGDSTAPLVTDDSAESAEPEPPPSLPAMRLVGRRDSSEEDTSVVESASSVDDAQASDEPVDDPLAPIAEDSPASPELPPQPPPQAEQEVSNEATVSSSTDSVPAPAEPDSGGDRVGDDGQREFSLQGTSIIDGKAVAVINEVRVFVGDWIGGARVVSITEREVQLDLDGTILTLTL